MTTGALLIAINNQQVDYVALAAWSSDRIRRHLAIPVALLTDDVGDHADSFDHVITISRPDDHSVRNINNTGRVTWYNSNRADAYDLTPWDRTLLLDADYVVASDVLAPVVQSDLDFAVHRWAHDVTGQNDFSGLNWFGQYRMPQWWATVIAFSKTPTARIIFDSMRMVRDNWTHFRELYSNRERLYRNDQALSIALAIESGHTLHTTDIPWSLATVMPHCSIAMLENDSFRIEYQDTENRPRYIHTHGQDLHVMAKDQLENMVADRA